MIQDSPIRIGTKSLLLATALVAGLVNAQDEIQPLDCMTASPIIGASEGTSFSDWKLIDKLTKDHVLTKIKVCTDTFDRNVFGLQLTYGGFTESGAALEEVPLDSHGIVDEGGIVKCDEKVLA